MLSELPQLTCYEAGVNSEAEAEAGLIRTFLALSGLSSHPSCRPNSQWTTASSLLLRPTPACNRRKLIGSTLMPEASFKPSRAVSRSS